MKNILFLLIIAYTATSCQNFLDTDPDSSLDTVIDNEEEIAELLTGAYPQASYFSFMETLTDNVEERPYGIHSQFNEAMFFWEDYEQEEPDTPLNYWNDCYRGIAQANKALELLAAYPKTERVKALYGEAFLIRAYLHFMLVNIWAEPYGTAKSNTAPGIPYQTKPEKNAFVNYHRGTVNQVYQKIEEDLKLGISLVNDEYYKKPKYHFNKKAAYAFASRFYLMKGEWKTVVEYANYVLGSNPQKKLRDWQSYTAASLNNTKLLYNRYTDTDESANLLLNTTESRIARNIIDDKYGLTFNAVNKVFNNTGIEGCSQFSKANMESLFMINRSPSPITEGRYIAKFDELSLFGYYGRKARGLYVTNVLFSTDEVMLNRMEAYAMMHQYEKSIGDLLNYLKIKYDIEIACAWDEITWASADNYNVYTPFYGMTIKQLALVKAIVGFRQKEFVHEGLRWFDIRRFYLPVNRSSKNSHYRPLTKEDPRKLLQIPSEAINKGLEPNPR